MKHGSHLSDDELMLALDGELDPVQMGLVENHLRQCWNCRERRKELEQSITEYVRAHRDLTPGIPPGDGPLSRLRAQMAAMSEEQAGAWRHWPATWKWFAGPALLCGFAAVVSGVLLSWWAGQGVPSGPLPDARLTPGATRLLSREQICAVPLEEDDRGVPAHLARQVFEQYRIARPKPRMYEVDYLISPALGGAEDIRNLWPQPYADGVWTSRVKDALEDHLRRMVCDGSLDLETAQREIATDWIAAYRKYFGAERPLASHALFVKDRPWE
jgi:anti-sigma factor RsiW